MTLNQKKQTVSLLIFATIIIVLGIPFTQWWLYGSDDFHAIYLAHITKTWKQLLYFFYEGHTAQGAFGPSNTPPSQRSHFFKTFYRPLYHIFHTLQYWIFGLNIYPYFIISVTIHAINTVLIFNLYTLFLPLAPATLGSLFFAFHPQIAFRFGQFVNQHYYINVMFILLSITFFVLYHNKKHWLYLFHSLIFYALSLFTRESTILFPMTIFIIAMMLENKQKFALKNIILAIKKTWFFGIISVSFLLFRLWLYPIKLSKVSPSTKTSLLIKISNKIPELKVFIYDFFALSWLPWGYPIIRSAVIIILTSIIVILLIKNKNKLFTTGLLVAGSVMMWPGLMTHYNPRYFYEGYAFFLAAKLSLLNYATFNWPKIIRQSAIPFFTLTVSTYCCFCLYNFSIRHTKMITIKNAMYDLVNKPAIQHQALCFVGHPADGFDANFQQFFWIYFSNNKIPIFFDQRIIFIQPNSHIFQSTPLCIEAAQYNSKDYISTNPIKNGFQYTLLNPHKIRFGDLQTPGFSIGKKIITRTTNMNNQQIITKFNLKIDKNILREKPIFIQWCYQKKRFQVLSTN